MRTTMRLLALCAALCVLCTACGYRGPLYMPDAAVNAPAKTTPAK